MEHLIAGYNKINFFYNAHTSTNNMCFILSHYMYTAFAIKFIYDINFL